MSRWEVGQRKSGLVKSGDGSKAKSPQEGQPMANRQQTQHQD